MPENIRAIVYIIFIVIIVFYLIKKIFKDYFDEKTINMWFLYWISITVCAFLIPNYWIFLFSSTFLIIFFQRSEDTKPVIFAFLIGIIPILDIQIPGFGIIDHFIKINFHIILILIIFSFNIREITEKQKNKNLCDYLIILYILYGSILYLRATTFTDSIRNAVLDVIYILLPYLIFSRLIRNDNDIIKVFFAYTVSMFILSAIAIFEVAKGWILYSTLNEMWSMTDAGGYTPRAGFLRAVGSFGGPIILGTAIMVGLGFFLTLARIGNLRRSGRIFGLCVLCLGLLSTLSRGPWVGAVALVSVYLFLGKSGVRQLFRFGALMVASLMTMTTIGIGNRFIDLLPIIGTDEEKTIGYRERLLENSLIVIERNPIFGSADYRSTPEMQDLTAGDTNVVDVVNTYLNLLLSQGILGLLIFILIIIIILKKVYFEIKLIKHKNEVLYECRRTIISTICGILVTISTTSSIDQIPLIYWMLAGLGVAAIRVNESLLQTESKSVTGTET